MTALGANWMYWLFPNWQRDAAEKLRSLPALARRYDAVRSRSVAMMNALREKGVSGSHPTMRSLQASLLGARDSLMSLDRTARSGAERAIAAGKIERDQVRGLSGFSVIVVLTIAAAIAIISALPVTKFLSEWGATKRYIIASETDYKAAEQLGRKLGITPDQVTIDAGTPGGSAMAKAVGGGVTALIVLAGIWIMAKGR